MDHSSILHGVFFAVFFLVITCILQVIAKRWSSIPYTAMLIIVGFSVQKISTSAGHPINIKLSPEIIYFILLPLLLFESSFRINIHHFRLQFHTISALATIGLLISVAVVAGIVAATTNLSLATALLFGAVISSTDPIAVIALFKQLGAPRRLGLVADGESMLNDATSVIVFKVIASIVIGSTVMNTDLFFENILYFFWVFLASIVFGCTMGAAASFFASRLRSNLLAMNLLATSLALFSFVSAESFFGLSGVIATVSFGVIFGNLAVPLFNHQQETAFDHFWEFVSLISLSIVFFFSSLAVDFGALMSSATLLPAVIAAVLVGRALSVYIVCAICNRLPLFRYEPKIPLSWQHVLNWGGLRGVIPLVLAYSLPLDYAFRDLLISLTIGCFLFTLLVNGFTIKPLLVFLKLHRPHRIEELYAVQTNLIATRERRARFEQLASSAFSQNVLEEQQAELTEKERKHVEILAAETSYPELLRSFRMAGNLLEREYTKDLFNKGYMNEQVQAAFTSQLNQQLDRIEYPDLPHRKIKKDFSFDTSTNWRNRLAEIFRISPSNRLLLWLFGATKERLLQTRFLLLQVRLITSQEALTYFSSLRQALENCPLAIQALDQIKQEQESYVNKNRQEMLLLRQTFPEIIHDGQRKLLKAALDDQDFSHLPA